MPYYLGIDGGGTKTTCAVGDESRLLASATAGPSNIVRVGEAQTRESLQHSVRQACAAAGITPGQISRTCVGGSGAARPELAAIVRGFLAEILSSPIDVVGDMQIALEAAFGTGPGVIVIAGTGSIAYGRDHAGNTARAGGWGFAIGDEGSAHWIGREAVRAVLRAFDRDYRSDRDHGKAENILHAELCRSFVPGVGCDTRYRRCMIWRAPRTPFRRQISPRSFLPLRPVTMFWRCRSCPMRAGNSPK